MSTKIQFFGLAALTVFSFGCNSGGDKPVSPEEKKAFMGSAPPKGYMDNIRKGPPPGVGAPGGPPSTAGTAPGK